jgi:valyl-tRNA synthetase
MEYQLSPASKWILEKYIELEHAIEQHVDSMELAHAIDGIYTFVWDYYADWYVEYLKTDSSQIPFATELYRQLIVTIAPFVPFETEAIWKEFFGSQQLLASYIKDVAWSRTVLNSNDNINSAEFVSIKDAVEKLRSLRGLFQLDPAVKIECQSQNEQLLNNADFFATIARTSLTAGSTGTYEIKGIGWSIFLDVLAYIKDISGQIAHTNKTILSLTKQITQLESQLGNESFLAHAEQEAIEQKKVDLATRKSELHEQETKLGFLQEV